MAEALAEVVAGPRAAVLLVSGAPGIGKSRLLESAQGMARDQRAFVLSAAAFESDSIRPFSIWIDALRARDARAHDEVFGGADVANRDRLFAGLSDLVTRESASGPVVLVFDDAQWLRSLGKR